MSALDDLAGPMRDLRRRFEDEVAPHRQALWNYCRRLTGSAWDAEDLVQEVMLKALAGLAALWQPLSGRAWLFRVATNAWIDRRRRAVREELDALADRPVDGAGPAETRLAAHEAIAGLVRDLTPLQRVVFLLTESLDFRAAEVAVLLGTTEGAVRAVRHRARAALAARAAAPPAGPPARLLPAAARDPLVQRYIAAFDARDPDALAALLHEEQVTVIVGSAEEHGRAATRANSLAEWAAEPWPQRAVPCEFDGREALVVLARPESGGAEVVHGLVTLETAGGLVTGQRIWFYCPELLGAAAAALGFPAAPRGHRWEG